MNIFAKLRKFISLHQARKLWRGLSTTQQRTIVQEAVALLQQHGVDTTLAHWLTGFAGFTDGPGRRDAELWRALSLLPDDALAQVLLRMKATARRG